MIGALWILVATVVMGLILYINHHLFSKKSTQMSSPTENEIVEPDECCGQHAVCEKDSLLTGVSSKIEYYDDEELDIYQGTTPDEYSDEQIEQFRDILYTLRADDIAGWYRSIQLRNIQLPAIINDELFLLISEKRNS